MENKKTTELLDLIEEKEKKQEYDEEYDEIKETLLLREPFITLHNDEHGTPLSESLAETDENVKKLKRHKHDKNGDVLIRI